MTGERTHWKKRPAKRYVAEEIKQQMCHHLFTFIVHLLDHSPIFNTVVVKKQMCLN